MSSRAPDFAVVELDGVPLSALDCRELVEHISSCLAQHRGGWVITANTDHLERLVRSEPLRRLYERADIIVADGMPLLWAARLQGSSLPGRVAGSDLVWLLAEEAARAGHSLYLLGGTAGAAVQAAERFQERFPGLHIAGTSSPSVSIPPAEAELDEIRAEIESANPDIVFVALGTPKQEIVIDALRAKFPTAWWVGVGISLSFVAGHVSRAPLWIQRIGLEWLHRLAQEPSRLANRYLVHDLPFVISLLHRAWNKRH
jgi:N-acetylglucosaminyldiphosphoundecaprenol N-acetyl-beta-D-mannosaminyltransferase